MNKWLEILMGLIFLVGAILIAFYSQGWGIWNFWAPAWAILKGSVFWLVALIGFVLILLGINDLRE